MPHYAQRPLSILRNTHGTSPFFQQHFLESSSSGLRVVKIPNADKDPDFTVVESPEGLLHLAQIGAVELHSWGAVMPKPTHADRLTFDLDPGAGLPYAQLREAALTIRKLMQEYGLESWVKTTGGKGLHVVVPLTKPLPDWEMARNSWFLRLSCRPYTLAMLGAASATGAPMVRSIRCLPYVAACAELPRAHVTTTCGGRRLRQATSSLRGCASASVCRATASGACATSLAMRDCKRVMGRRSLWEQGQTPGDKAWHSARRRSRGG